MRFAKIRKVAAETLKRFESRYLRFQVVLFTVGTFIWLKDVRAIRALVVAKSICYATISDAFHIAIRKSLGLASIGATSILLAVLLTGLSLQQEIQNKRRPVMFKVEFDGDIYVSTIDTLREHISVCIASGPSLRR